MAAERCHDPIQQLVSPCRRWLHMRLQVLQQRWRLLELQLLRLWKLRWPWLWPLRLLELQLLRLLKLLRLLELQLLRVLL